jgi:hypothetical protein
MSKKTASAYLEYKKDTTTLEVKVTTSGTLPTHVYTVKPKETFVRGFIAYGATITYTSEEDLKGPVAITGSVSGMDVSITWANGPTLSGQLSMPAGTSTITGDGQWGGGGVSMHNPLTLTPR